MAASSKVKNPSTYKLPGKIWFSLISLGFVGSLAWAVENQFFNTFLYNKITPDPRPISWMVAASALTATVASILIGTLGDRLPLLVRAGSILPMGPLMQFIPDDHRFDELELHFYPPFDGSATLYDDDPETRAYLQGEYAQTKVSVKKNGE